MTAREVAVVIHSDAGNLYGVRVRRRALGCLWWWGWRKCRSGRDECGFPRERAQYLADQALEHGWVEEWPNYAHPIIGKDEE